MTPKGGLTGTFIAVSVYIKIEGRSQKQKKKNKPKASKRKEIKVREEISGIENRRTIEDLNKANNSFLEEINKTDKTLARSTKGKREKTQIRN